MKLKRKFFQNIYKKPNEFKNGKFFISYFLFLFFLNCIPDERPTYNSLLTSFFFTPKDQSIEFTNTSSTRISDSDEDLNVLSYNLFLYSKEDTYFGYWEEEERAELLAKSKFMKNQDVIVLEEAFDMNARNILLNNLALEYPDQTDVIGKTRDGWNQTLGDFRQNVNNGGVVVLSKWPIQEKIQYIFKNHGCGNDALYDKGFAYVKIKKGDRIIHILGVDTQSQDSACSDLGVGARTDQIAEIGKFISSKQIPKKDIVLIVGSLNVDKNNKFYYQKMLTVLKANEPNYAGIPFTWDPKKNKIAAYNNSYYSWNWTPNYGEYILVSKDHFQFPVWQNLAYDPISPTTWKRLNGYTSYEFSDHFPIYGFVYADPSTPTKSGHRRKYDQVSLIAKYTGKAVQADHNRPDGWLKADGPVEEKGTEFTKFNLLQEYDPDSDTFCMLSGRVRIESSQYLNYFWTWWLQGGAGNYAYYPKFDNGSKLLEMIVTNQGCLKDGDSVVFKDFDIYGKYYYFLVVWDRGSWKDYIYLWYENAQPNSFFNVKLNTSPERDWSKDLIYHKLGGRSFSL
ncbi:sphingomyelin phosphodiesterase [Leptospira mayottensis]|uniref:Sphingomyelin phosphodiesterase n=2 Tax=Leptospira mayottensis TaxID=1137606 RepID=A0AA87MRL6_9LEPT|nr:sphingomyelin phosphodiesterase [Leptospira mayottensis]AXR59740.1 sphingomyelin phosphodiesterase [Leptospira mayottensis]AXR64012.1 sphingomyelin phosphodiesterase [Leptospira mayottensis]AZQ00940.1 sphingomyelin phosphodiesterase [Leptospira mayottensis 200901116]EKS00496.1 sphingomyelin phosphodiesterase [Leptospira mayottensis 200901122]TGN11836.1 sphingomyelin phosphodiesterase [Leptospira mayottensis]